MISVIIPALNEEQLLPALLRKLVPNGEEVIVVDGGSSDSTLKAAKRFPVRVIESPRGRALQMNAGAAAASGDILWFLHADSDPPPDWKGRILRALEEPGVVGGGFRVRIDAPGIGYRFLDLWGWMRSRVQRSFYGDQGIFVRRALFDALNGYDPASLVEDLDFSTRLSRRGKVVLLAGPLRTSARRWRTQGWWRTVAEHSRMAFGYGLNRPGGPVVVIVMAKAPVPGQVKTRLIPAVGADQAALIARRLLQEMVAKVLRLAGVQPVLALDPGEAIPDVRRILDGAGQEGSPLRIIPQPEGDLGQRLSRLFADAFGGSAGGVVVVGTDHPGLPIDYLRQAVRLVSDKKDQAVFGPTEDGGYYLVGLTRPHQGLFEGIRWSSSTVLEETLKRAKRLGVPVRLIPGWFDLDRPEDLDRLDRTRPIFTGPP